MKNLEIFDSYNVPLKNDMAYIRIRQVSPYVTNNKLYDVVAILSLIICLYSEIYMLYFQKLFIQIFFFFIISYLELKRPLIHQHIDPMINHINSNTSYSIALVEIVRGGVGLLLCIIFCL